MCWMQEVFFVSHEHLIYCVAYNVKTKIHKTNNNKHGKLAQIRTVANYYPVIIGYIHQTSVEESRVIYSEQTL